MMKFVVGFLSHICLFLSTDCENILHLQDANTDQIFITETLLTTIDTIAISVRK